MITIKPDYFNNFICLKGDCPSSCCEKWQVVIDKNSLDYYSSLEGDFGNQLREKTVEADGDFCFEVTNGRCAFLNDKGLCDIHCNIGWEHMAETCKKYPDFSVECNTVTIKGQSASCPFVSNQIISRKDKISFTKLGKAEEDLYEGFFVNSLFKLIDIIQNRDIPLKVRIKNLLITGEALQKSLCDNFDTEVFVPEDNKNLKAWLGTLSCLEYLTTDGKALFDDLSKLDATPQEAENFSKHMAMREYEYEQILLYFFYRYFFEYAGDGDIMLPIRFAIFCTRVILNMGMMLYCKTGKFTSKEQIKLCYTFCKEIEHSQSNLDIILEDLSLGMI